MEMNMDDEQKMVDIWLTRAEKNDPSVRARLNKIYAENKKRGYFVVVFESGERDLYRSTLDLLAYNKRRCAQLEVQREKSGKRGKTKALER